MKPTTAFVYYTSEREDEALGIDHMVRIADNTLMIDHASYIMRSSLTLQIIMVTRFPGYEYDDSRHCYFRIPPKHYEAISNYRTLPLECPKKYLPAQNLIGCKLHCFLQNRSISIKSVQSSRFVRELLMARLERKNRLRLSDTSSNFLQCDNIMIDKFGELLAFQCTTERGDTCSTLYHLKLQPSGYCCETLWRSSNTMSPGLYCMDFTSDVSDTKKYFLCLCHDSIVVWKYSNSKMEQSQTKKLSNTAACMIAHPSSNSWDQVYFAVGFHSGNIQTYNLDYKTCFTSTKLKTNILSLATSLEDPLLFAGCRNGTCYIWDIRQGISPIASITELLTGTRARSSIIGLHPFHDHNYFVANALNSKLSLWDLRMQKKVLAFHGHTNEYKVCKSIVDQFGSSVIAVGSDGNTRIWSTRTGTMLHCLLNTSSQNTLPLISYSEHLGGDNGEPSLLMTEDDNLLVYSFK